MGCTGEWPSDSSSMQWKRKSAYNEEEKHCECREIEENMGVIKITFLIIKMAEQPPMRLCDYLIDQAANPGRREKRKKKARNHRKEESTVLRK